MERKLAADFGINIGDMEKGKLDNICDVKGVTVGHSTIRNERYRTGVTVVMPSQDDVYHSKFPAACFVQNGFGKTTGLIQIEELGQLESPIALTSTLNVGLVHDALVEYMGEEIRRRTGDRIYTYNPIVCETNDSETSFSCDRPVKKENVFEAIANATTDFEQGDVGAGTGTICHRFKGGIGSASRLVEIGGNIYTLGILVQTNQGEMQDLTVNGCPKGREIMEKLNAPHHDDYGSIIVILATDAPLSDRQLKRTLKRCTVGIARVGSHLGHGSGDVYIGFSTANRINGEALGSAVTVGENYVDGFFRAAVEATEEAILNSLFAADEISAPTGAHFYSLRQFYENK